MTRRRARSARRWPGRKLQGGDHPLREPVVLTRRAARLSELLGLSDEELCTILDEDPLTVLSGDLGHRPEVGILLGLLEEADRTAGPGLLRRWVRATGPRGRPLDQLMARDFVAFEESVAALAQHGFVLRSGG